MKSMKILLATFALCLVPMLFAQERFKAGLWENTTTGGDSPGVTNTCLAAGATEVVNGPPAVVRANAEKSAAKFNMKITKYAFDGTTITMTMVSGSSVYMSKASYRGDTFENVITTHTMGRVSTKTIKGKRIGPCP